MAIRPGPDISRWPRGDSPGRGHRGSGHVRRRAGCHPIRRFRCTPRTGFQRLRPGAYWSGLSTRTDSTRSFAGSAARWGDGRCWARWRSRSCRALAGRKRPVSIAARAARNDARAPASVSANTRSRAATRKPATGVACKRLAAAGAWRGPRAAPADGAARPAGIAAAAAGAVPMAPASARAPNEANANAAGSGTDASALQRGTGRRVLDVRRSPSRSSARSAGRRFASNPRDGDRRPAAHAAPRPTVGSPTNRTRTGKRASRRGPSPLRSPAGRR